MNTCPIIHKNMQALEMYPYSSISLDNPTSGKMQLNSRTLEKICKIKQYITYIENKRNGNIPVN